MTTDIPIDQLSNAMRPWYAVITVDEKLQPFQGVSSPTRVQKFIFSDSKGAKVEGIIFDADIQRMGPKLQTLKKYRIGNADIRPANPKYARQGIAMQWVISSRTVIDEIVDKPTIIRLHYDYTKFDSLGDFIDEDDKTKRVDVLAVAIDVLPVKTVTKPWGESKVQKFVLVNDQMQSIMISMWNQFVPVEGQAIINDLRNFPVVICRRVRPTYYNGVELLTCRDSMILVNPPDEEAMRLKNWVARNEKELTDFVRTKSYLKYGPDITLRGEKNATLIANMLPTQNVALVKANISFKNIMQNYWYMGCINCYAATSASPGYEYQCNLCGEKQMPKPRCRLELDLTDQSGTITASIFGEQAEKILGFSAFDAMMHTDNGTTPPLDSVHKDLDSKIFHVHVKQPKAKSEGSVKRYTIVNISEYVESGPISNLASTDPTQLPSQGSHPQIDATQTISETILGVDTPAKHATRTRTRRSLAETMESASTDAEDTLETIGEGTSKRLKSKSIP